MLMMDGACRTQILRLYATGMRQAEIADWLGLPVALVADVLDCKI